MGVWQTSGSLIHSTCMCMPRHAGSSLACKCVCVRISIEGYGGWQASGSLLLSTCICVTWTYAGGSQY